MAAACLEVPEESAVAPDSPDAAPAGGPVSSSTCEALFGSAPAYMLCGETSSTCQFAADDPDDQDFVCRTMCGSHQCLSGFDTDGLSCDALTEDGCNAEHQSQICVCAR
jgi:hypothetical protein